MKISIKKLNQKGVFHISMIFPVLIMGAVIAIGLRVLYVNHAATPGNTIIVANTSSTAATLKNEAILNYTNVSSGVQTASAEVPLYFVKNPIVSILGQGQTLTYNNGIKGSETSCYSVYVSPPKSGTEILPVEFANNNNHIIVNLSSNDTDNLQQVCVPPGNLTNPGFDIKDLATSRTSPGGLEVYEDAITW